MHTIYITYYGTSGNVSTWYTPSISIYETPNTLIETGAMTYNATIKQYKYNFTAFDSTKEYIANIDFGASAPMRYASVLVAETSVDTESIANAVDTKITESHWEGFYNRVWGGGGWITSYDMKLLIDDYKKELQKNYDKIIKQLDEDNNINIIAINKDLETIQGNLREINEKIPKEYNELNIETLLRVKKIDEYIQKKNKQETENNTHLQELSEITKEIQEMMKKEQEEREELEEVLKDII